MVDLKIKAVFFDFMGTCLDCHSGVIQVLPQSITKLALEWRHDYFNANAARLAANEPPKNIDITLRNTLDALLKRYPEYEPFDESSKQQCVIA